MIYFVRHGATDWNENKDRYGNKDPKCQGRADMELNEKGKQQALEAALALNNKKFDRVLCSPLKRARQTCYLIYKGNCQIEIDNRLIERDFGEFEGLPRSQFDFYGFWNENSKQKYEKAESLGELKERVLSLLLELEKDRNKDILIVSHGGVGGVLVSYFKGEPKDGNYLRFEVQNGKPIILDFKDFKANQ